MDKKDTVIISPWSFLCSVLETVLGVGLLVYGVSGYSGDHARELVLVIAGGFFLLDGSVTIGFVTMAEELVKSKEQFLNDERNDES